MLESSALVSCGASPRASASFLALSYLSFSSLANTIADLGLLIDGVFFSSFFVSTLEVAFVFEPPPNREPDDVVEVDLSLSSSVPNEVPLPPNAEKELFDSS